MSGVFFILAAALLTGGSSNSIRSTDKYYVSSQPVSFAQAWAYCRNAGMKFAFLPTAADNDALGRALESLGPPIEWTFWIGGIYLRNAFLTKWYWVDGEGDFSYTNWKSTPSVPATEDHCIVYHYSGVTKKGDWMYTPCATAKYFICQF